MLLGERENAQSSNIKYSQKIKRSVIHVSRNAFSLLERALDGIQLNR
jgi:hypothetical protein